MVIEPLLKPWSGRGLEVLPLILRLPAIQAAPSCSTALWLVDLSLCHWPPRYKRVTTLSEVGIGKGGSCSCEQTGSMTAKWITWGQQCCVRILQTVELRLFKLNLCKLRFSGKRIYTVLPEKARIMHVVNDWQWTRRHFNVLRNARCLRAPRRPMNGNRAALHFSWTKDCSSTRALVKRGRWDPNIQRCSPPFLQLTEFNCSFTV